MALSRIFASILSGCSVAASASWSLPTKLIHPQWGATQSGVNVARLPLQMAELMVIKHPCPRRASARLRHQHRDT